MHASPNCARVRSYSREAGPAALSWCLGQIGNEPFFEGGLFKIDRNPITCVPPWDYACYGKNEIQKTKHTIVIAPTTDFAGRAGCGPSCGGIHQPLQSGASLLAARGGADRRDQRKPARCQGTRVSGRRPPVAAPGPVQPVPSVRYRGRADGRSTAIRSCLCNILGGDRRPPRARPRLLRRAAPERVRAERDVALIDDGRYAVALARERRRVRAQNS
jgi:hypothetical protein